MTSVSNRFRAARLGPLLLTVSLVLARPARAEPSTALTRTAAREIALDGAQLYEQKDYLNALERFRRAYAVFPAPTIAIMEARSLVALGRLVEALDKYEETARTPLAGGAPLAFRRAVADATQEREQLKPRIPRITLQIDAETRKLPGFQVSIDDSLIGSALWDVALPVDPGAHVVRALASGRAPHVRTLRLSESGHELVSIDLDAHRQPSPAPDRGRVESSSTARTLGWTALGVGALGLGTSVVTGVLALGKKSDLDEVCRPGCPRSAEDDIDAFRTQRTVSYVSFGIGAIAAGVGGYLLWVRDESPRVGAVMTPTSAALTGVF